MRKTIVMVLSCVLTLAFSTAMISPSQADIERFTWLPSYMKKGYDSYYDAYVVIYKDGSSVNLIVPVENDNGYLNGLNVSKVIVSFDWGQNKTLDLSANIEQVGWHETEIFTVSFTASATEAVSSDWAHEYTIYVEHVNATTGPTEIVGTWSRPWYWGSPAYLFVVFPTDQADAYDLSQEYDSYANTYPTSSFGDINASQLAGQANIEGSLGDMHYTRGEYASAETHYQTALNLYSQALSAEKNYQTTSQDASLNTTLTTNAAALIVAKAAQTTADAALVEANASKIQAEAALTNAYGFFFIGLGFAIGWSFIGVGVMIYALRKPKLPT